MPESHGSLYAMIYLSPSDLKFASCDKKLAALIDAKTKQAALALWQEIKKRRAELFQ